MALVHRKKRPLERKPETPRDAKLIIIGTEGRKTEQQYFALFQDTRVQVKVIPTGDDNKSAPQHVFQRLKDFEDKYQLAGDDELWLMLDVDRWKTATLRTIAREAVRCQYGLAISNPCFEVWLLFHFNYADNHSECKKVEAELRKSLGRYNKSRIELDLFQAHVDEALQRAIETDQNPQARWPSTTGTHVYKVIQSIKSIT